MTKNGKGVGGALRETRHRRDRKLMGIAGAPPILRANATRGCRGSSERSASPLTRSRPLPAKGGARLRSHLASHFAPAFCAYSQEACDSGTVRLADSTALAFAAVPSRMRPAIPWVIPASRNRL
jgi:hypothetical protein